MLNRILKNAASPCVVNGWNKPDPDFRSFNPEGVMLHWILLELLKGKATVLMVVYVVYQINPNTES